MIDEVDVEVDIHRGAGRERREFVIELGDAGEGERAPDGDLPSAALLPLLDLDQRKAADREEDRDGDADAHAGEQIHARDPDHRSPVDTHFIVDGQFVDVVKVDEIDADVDEQAGQHRQGDALDHRTKEEHAEQDPDAMEDGRPARDAPGVDIGRGTDDDAGDGQTAKQAGDKVAGALGGEFLVEVRPLTAMQFVGGHGAQERLHAGDDRQGEHGDDEATPLGRELQLSEGERLRQVDAGDVHLRHEGDDGAGDDGHQGRRDGPEAGPRQFLPKHQHEDGHDAESRGRGTEGTEASRQRDQIRDRRAGGRAAE